MRPDVAVVQFSIDLLFKIDRFGLSGMAFDLSSPHGRMLATFLSGIAEFERDLISERVKSRPRRSKSTRQKTRPPSWRPT